MKIDGRVVLAAGFAVGGAATGLITKRRNLAKEIDAEKELTAALASQLAELRASSEASEAAHAARVAELEAQVASGERRTEELTAQLAEAEAAAHAASGSLGAVRAELEQREATLASLRAELESTCGDLAAARQQHTDAAAAAQAELAMARTEVSAARSDVSAMKDAGNAAIQHLKEQVELATAAGDASAAAALAKSQQEAADERAKADDVKSKLAAAEAAIGALKKEKEEALAAAGDAHAALASAEKFNSRLKKRLAATVFTAVRAQEAASKAKDAAAAETQTAVTASVAVVQKGNADLQKRLDASTSTISIPMVTIATQTVEEEAVVVPPAAPAAAGSSLSADAKPYSPIAKKASSTPSATTAEGTESPTIKAKAAAAPAVAVAVAAPVKVSLPTVHPTLPVTTTSLKPTVAGSIVPKVCITRSASLPVVVSLPRPVPTSLVAAGWSKALADVQAKPDLVELLAKSRDACLLANPTGSDSDAVLHSLEAILPVLSALTDRITAIKGASYAATAALALDSKAGAVVGWALRQAMYVARTLLDRLSVDSAVPSGVRKTLKEWAEAVCPTPGDLVSVRNVGFFTRGMAPEEASVAALGRSKDVLGGASHAASCLWIFDVGAVTAAVALPAAEKNKGVLVEVDANKGKGKNVGGKGKAAGAISTAAQSKPRRGRGAAEAVSYAPVAPPAFAGRPTLADMLVKAPNAESVASVVASGPPTAAAAPCAATTSIRSSEKENDSRPSAAPKGNTSSRPRTRTRGKKKKDGAK